LAKEAVFRICNRLQGKTTLLKGNLEHFVQNCFPDALAPSFSKKSIVLLIVLSVFDKCSPSLINTFLKN
jgi:hypothetical protein